MASRTKQDIPATVQQPHVALVYVPYGAHPEYPENPNWSPVDGSSGKEDA
jgi:hypothetical protein